MSGLCGPPNREAPLARAKVHNVLAKQPQGERADTSALEVQPLRVVGFIRTQGGMRSDALSYCDSQAPMCA